MIELSAVVALGFVLLSGNERSRSRFRDFYKRLERIGRRFFAEAQNFDGADQIFILNQRNIAHRANSTASVDMGIVFAL